jgi:hypothetical protein
MENKQQVKAAFAAKPPVSYAEIVKTVVEAIGDEADYYTPDPDRIHAIDDGNYQSTLVFVIGSTGYQPSDYWYVRGAYGSCSGCDTLQAIQGYSSEAPTEQQLDDYVKLAQDIVTGLHKMGEDIES